MSSDPTIKDSDRTGDDLIARIDELTEGMTLALDGGDGWRYLLLACAREIRQLSRIADRHAAEINRRHGEMSVARAELTECGVASEDGGITLTTSQRIRRLGYSLDFYRSRCLELERRFGEWPEPARTEAANILANGEHKP